MNNMFESVGIFSTKIDLMPISRWGRDKNSEDTHKSPREMRARITNNTKKKVYKKYQHLCALCGGQVKFVPGTKNDPWQASIDHIIPLSHGGTNDINNLQLAHVRCNTKRGNRIKNHFPKWFKLETEMFNF